MDLILELLRHITGMAWKIAWGLVLGFAISAAIQTFVSRERIAEHLGGFGLWPVLKATGFGAASSSCSYAAAAMSKSLFQKGAHIVTATAFLFAATNLVVEIGLVIWVLLGWRFVAAEFFGGVLLILLVSVLLKWFAPEGVFEEAREHLRERADEGGHHHGGGHLPFRKIFSRRGVRAVGRYFATDWKMIGKDIALGLAIAGSLAALVPVEWWETLFLAGGTGDGHPGFWVSLENAVVGPVIAIVSFVCSVGNIPLAAVLWSSGISFGGVIAFIFADLVTIPMVLVYREYYGWKPALVYAGYLLVTMIAVALVVDGLFRWIGLAPAAPAGGPGGIAEIQYFAWDYTTWLNLVFLPLGGWLYWIGTTAPAVAESEASAAPE
jgi:uncharacterized membrane protein YraQ (UPF0718 family)